MAISTEPAGTPKSSFTALDEVQLIRTIESLHRRVAAQFPGSGLSRVCEQFLGVARRAAECDRDLRRPHWPLRLAAGAAILALSVVLGFLVANLRQPETMTAADVVQTIEAGVNDIVFFGIAVFFLVTMEVRAKRRRALAMLHELRSLTHIVDMHQLAKDPELLAGDDGSKVRREMTPAELGRYLDFCSDMLSLIAKVAALLVQHFNDDVVLGAVGEIEALTTGLSSKIWLKITILERPSLSS